MWRFAALALVMAAPAMATPSAEAEAVVDAFHSALANGDTRGAAALLADDALIFEEGRAERSKA
jgi:ketosteroid isomerase-like protein